MRAKEVGLLGYNGVIASHLTLIADVLKAAFLEDGFGGRLPCYRVRTIGLTRKPFLTDSGLLISPQETLEAAPSFDTLIVAGGDGLRHGPAAETLAEWILSRSCATRRIASICTGIYALAPTGLLDGRDVTTHWRCAQDVAHRFPTLRVNHKRRLVKDGPFYTSAGLTAPVDLGLALIEEDYGKQLSASVGRDLMMYLAGTSEPDQAWSTASHESQPANRFGELVAWIMKNLQQDLSVEVMARRACMSPAHFSRAFRSVLGTTPGQFVENLRLHEARRRLSSQRKTLSSIAASVGFDNTVAFRRAFERRFGAGPAKYLHSRDANGPELNVRS